MRSQAMRRRPTITTAKFWRLTSTILRTLLRDRWRRRSWKRDRRHFSRVVVQDDVKSVSSLQRRCYRDSSAPPGLAHLPLETHGLRRGLHSFAASRLVIFSGTAEGRALPKTYAAESRQPKADS